MAASVRERSTRYAAMCHAASDILCHQATLLKAPAPETFKNLTGLNGLATLDPTWEALLQADAAVGLGFITDGFSKGDHPTDNTFPSDEGFAVWTMHVDGRITYEMQDSAVVRFRSAPADADGTLHSLVQSRDGRCCLPPMATITLERIQQPGEWEANGHRVRRLLFSVSVSYRC